MLATGGEVIRFGTDVASQIKKLVLDSLGSQNSKRAYGRAMDRFLSWCSSTHPDHGFCRATVIAYKAWLAEQPMSPATQNLCLAAVRKLALEASYNQFLSHEVAHGIARVTGVRSAGARIGNWLTKTQVERLVSLPDRSKLKGLRDRALLLVMISTGLRRDEVVSLEVGRIEQRDGRWVLVDLIGKGNRTRSVALAPWAKAAVDAWLERAAITSGPVFRSVSKGGRIGAVALAMQALAKIIGGYGAAVGVPALAPHDLRRTYARLAGRGRVPLDQIQKSLGHSSIRTTQVYLGDQQDFADAPCDHLGLEIE